MDFRGQPGWAAVSIRARATLKPRFIRSSVAPQEVHLAEERQGLGGRPAVPFGNDDEDDLEVVSLQALSYHSAGDP